MENNIDEDRKNIKSFIRSIRSDLEDEAEDNYKLANSISNVLSELEELRKYDIRKIELKNGMIEKAPSFTKREIELMNLGIALYCNN